MANQTTMPPLSHLDPDALHIVKRRRPGDGETSSAAYEMPLPAAREASICARFDGLNLNNSISSSSNNNNNKSMSSDALDTGAQAISRAALTTPPPPPTPSRPSGIPTSANMRKQPRASAHSQLEVPKTPAQIYEASATKLKESLTTILYTTSPTKRNPFLTKCSNTRGFTETDIDERLGKFDSELQKMKEVMDSTAVDKDRYVEKLDAAEKRGKLLIFCPAPAAQ